MKEQCERTRKALPAYLRGHVFRITRNRIDRHLQACAVCRSEFDALKRTEETRQLLKDIDSPEGVVQRVKQGISELSKIKKILYRPLWLAGITLVAAGISYYAMLPRQLDLEIESIVKTGPVATATGPAAGTKMEEPLVNKPVTGMQMPAPLPVPDRAVTPLAVSIVPVNETTAIQRINEVMSGNGELRKMVFSDTERKLSGTLTAQELLTLFDRMREVAKVRYDRRRFKSFPPDEQVPFVLTLKAAPRAVEKPIVAPQRAETQPSAVTAAPAPPATAPATSTPTVR
jgi:hypothetical protein